MPETAIDQMAIVLLGGILCMAGQGIRAIIGLAGVMAALNSMEAVLDTATVTAFGAAGYAGTDFIEGFMRRSTPS